MSRLAALAYPDVRRYVSARFLVAVAVQMQTVAVGWQVFQITHDPFDLGLIGLSQFLPFIVLVLPAGQLSDRYDRRRIVLACYLIAALAAAALALLSATPVTSVAPIFGVMALFGIARAIIMPTTQALLPNLVPAGTFGNAVALNTSLLEVATIGGPAVAGVLILLGTGWVYVICAALCLSGALMTLGLSTGGRMRTPERVSMTSLFSGITFVRGNRTVLGSISLDLFAVLFGGAMALLPAFASDVLHVGPTGLGLLRAAPAVGAGLPARSSPSGRCDGRWDAGSSDAWRCSGCRRSSLASRRASCCRSWRWSSWAVRTWSACTSGTCSCSSRRRTPSAAG